MSAAAPAWKESISLDETNKIRISLGLKPLSDSGPSKTSEAMAEDNYAKRQADDAKERDAAALKLRIDKAKNAQERKKQLVGVGLGDDEHEGIKNEDGGVGGGGDLDNKKWVKQQKKRAKELAAKRAKEMEEMDKRFAEEGLPKYGEQDLKGIKVSHGEDDFEEGEDVVLTLKDSRVLDDEGECTSIDRVYALVLTRWTADDELHNLNISENTKTADALALKKKGRLAGAYTGYDDEEFEGADGAKKGVLSKYDEEIEGREEGGFRLGGPAAPKKAGAKGKAKAEEVEEKERVKLDLNYTSELESLTKSRNLYSRSSSAESFVTDYLQEDEVGFKVKVGTHARHSALLLTPSFRLQKKKKRPIRVTTDSLGEDGSMDVDGAGPSAVAPSLARVNLEETNLVDDDDLQAALARARREVNKKRILEMKAFAATATPAADSMDIERVKAESEDDDDANLGDDVIVLDDASEFVRNITLAAARAADVAAAAAIKVEQGIRTSMVASKATNGLASIAPVIKAEEEDTPLSEVVGGWGPAREDGEESDDGGADVDMADGYEEGPGDGEDVKPMTSAADEALPATGTEHLVSRGMASTLSILRSQGLIKTRTPEELAADQARKEKEKWLATQRKREVDKEAERQASRDAGGSKDQAQREYENRKRAADEARQSHEAYADYKPVVNLTYHDEFGRDQTPKEVSLRPALPSSSILTF